MLCDASISQTVFAQLCVRCGVAASLWCEMIRGCPLSAFPFSIVMTVLFFDTPAKLAMEVEAKQLCVLPINELVYVDDTLVVAAGPWQAETHMSEMYPTTGMSYGFRLNNEKFKVLPIDCEACITAPDTIFPTCKGSSSDLRRYLDASGAAGSEICMTLG